MAPALAERLIADGIVDPAKLRIAAKPAKRHAGADPKCVCSGRWPAPGPGIGMEAAYHGLDLTRPFHDKRVVELALAIPEELYVKNGRNRYLACMALKDIYPPEYQTRWRKNDDEIPGFSAHGQSLSSRESWPTSRAWRNLRCSPAILISAKSAACSRRARPPTITILAGSRRRCWR